MTLHLEFFGLNPNPFINSTTDKPFFDGGGRGATIEAIIYAISQAHGITKLIGANGSGKTFFCKFLCDRLNRDAETVLVNQKIESPSEIFSILMNKKWKEDLKNQKKYTAELRKAVEKKLVQNKETGKQTVLILTNSEQLKPEVLEEIVKLAALEENSHKLIQILMVGLPILDDILAKKNPELLRHVAYSFSLKKFNEEDTKGYLSFALEHGNYTGPTIFNEKVCHYLSLVTEGSIKKINILADKALQAAATENTRRVFKKHIDFALKECNFSVSKNYLRVQKKRRYTIVGIITLGSFLLLFIAFSVKNQSTQQNLHQAENQKLAADLEPSKSSETIKPTIPPDEDTVNQIDHKKTPNEETNTLMDRLEATKIWLENANSAHYTIQLFGSNNERVLEGRLHALAKELDLKKIYLFRTQARQSYSISVLYNSFDSLEHAESSLQSLPDSIKKNNPYLRTLGGIKSEIKTVNQQKETNY